jgi:peroxin-7
MLWDISVEESLVERCEHHTEFVIGLDFNIFIEGQVATCGWDSMVYCWMLGQDPTKMR